MNAPEERDMRHSSHDSACAICRSNAGDAPIPGGIVFENDLWLVRHSPPPFGVAGWMTLQSQRHVGGPAHFNDAEAANFGLALRHFEKVLEEVTGALRIYTAAMGESYPHLHAHMVPRRAQMPDDAKAWAVFDLQRRAAAGEVTVDAAEVERIITTYRARLAASPPPR
jgi:diadenosine tetraphosphate (Ap4A) HIT family hydrolase